MIVLQIILAVLAVLIAIIVLLILFARVRIVLIAQNDLIKVTAHLLGIRIFHFSTRQKEHHKKIKISDYSADNIKNKLKKEIDDAKKKIEARKKQPESELSEIKESLSSSLNILKIFLKHFYSQRSKVTVHRFNISVATDDPSKTAILYGSVIQAVAYFLEFINNTTTLHIPHSVPINVTSDFCAQSPQLDIKLSLVIKLIKFRH